MFSSAMDGFGDKLWWDPRWKRSSSLAEFVRNLQYVEQDICLEPSVHSELCNRRKVAINNLFLVLCKDDDQLFLDGRIIPLFRSFQNSFFATIKRSGANLALRITWSWYGFDVVPSSVLFVEGVPPVLSPPWIVPIIYDIWLVLLLPSRRESQMQRLVARIFVIWSINWLFRRSTSNP